MPRFEDIVKEGFKKKEGTETPRVAWVKISIEMIVPVPADKVSEAITQAKKEWFEEAGMGDVAKEFDTSLPSFVPKTVIHLTVEETENPHVQT